MLWWGGEGHDAVFPTFAILSRVTQARTQLLDYFIARRRMTSDDHVIFNFESSMEFGAGERALMDQASPHPTSSHLTAPLLSSPLLTSPLLSFPLTWKSTLTVTSTFFACFLRTWLPRPFHVCSNSFGSR